MKAESPKENSPGQRPGFASKKFSALKGRDEFGWQGWMAAVA